MTAERADVLGADRAAVRSAPNWLFIFSAITVLVLALIAARLSMARPINFDEAYNLQIAKSIGTSFCYCTRYRPERVFPVEESTNGIVQYVGGAFFAFTQSPDVAKTGTVAAAMLVLGAVLLLLDPWLVLLTALLFFVWYVLVYVSINVFGEPWAIAFSLLGIFLLRKCDLTAALRTLLTSRAFLAAVACFGIAAESKLLAALVIVPVAWAITVQRGGGKTYAVRASRATCITAAVGAGTALMLLLLVAFSVIHSMRTIDVGAIWQIFSGFISNMAAQGQGQAQSFDAAHVAQILSRFDSPIVLALLVLSTAVLLYVNWAYLFFVLVTLTWWLHYGANERHAVISLFVMIILAGLEGHALIERVSSERRTSSVKLALGACGLLAAVALAVGLASHATFDAPGAIKPIPNREDVVQTAEGRYHYSERLVNMLRHERYVVASGWGQFPEITLREHLEFYDRMSPANAALPRSQVVLLFDKGNTNFPLTSIRGNCERVLYTEGPIILCAVRRDVPLDFQPAS